MEPRGQEFDSATLPPYVNKLTTIAYRLPPIAFCGSWQGITDTSPPMGVYWEKLINIWPILNVKRLKGVFVVLCAHNCAGKVIALAVNVLVTEKTLIDQRKIGRVADCSGLLNRGASQDVPQVRILYLPPILRRR